MHLSRISPFGPIFGMELRVASRRKRNYVLRVAYLGGLLLFLLFAYAMTSEWGMSGVAARARQQEALGWGFFMCFSLFSVSAMALIGPVLTSTAISGERLHKTYHVLLMTPINAWQIAAGKLFSRLLTALVLIVLSLPVLALVRLLGGVEISDMFGVIFLAAATCMATAALGLLYSTLLNRTYVVILLSYATILFVYLFIPLMCQLLMVALMRNRRGPMRWMFTLFRVICAINPPACTGMIVSGASRMGLNVSWLPCILTHVGATAVLLALTGLLLRARARREGEGPTVAPTMAPGAGGVGLAKAQGVVAQGGEGAGLAKPQAEDPGSVAVPLPLLPPSANRYPEAPARAMPKPRTVSDNPILWREVRKPILAKIWQRWTLAGVVLGLLFITYMGFAASDGLDERVVHAGYACIFYSLLTLLVCVLSGTAIAQEKESDTWTLLLATPVSARDIIGGKLAGIVARMGWPMALFALHMAVFSLGQVISWRAALLSLWVMVTFNSIWIATGLYLSLRVAKVTTAVILNLLLPVLLYGGLSLLLLTIAGLMQWSEFRDYYSWYLPYFHMGVPLSGMIPGSETVALHLPGVHETGTFAEFASITIIIGLVHLVAAAGIVFLTGLGFNRIVGRAGQAHPIRPHGMEIVVR